MRKRLLTLLLLFPVPGCEIAAPDGPVEVRVENAAAAPMEAVFVAFPDDDILYGDVAPGTTTDYRTVERAYRYAYVRAVVDADTLVLQPIDYVGESLLDPGRYTYRLDLAGGTEAPSLTLDLVVD